MTRHINPARGPADDLEAFADGMQASADALLGFALRIRDIDTVIAGALQKEAAGLGETVKVLRRRAHELPSRWKDEG